MISRCLDRKEVRIRHMANAQGDRPAGGNIGQLLLAFGRPVCTNRISNRPLDRVLTYKNLTVSPDKSQGYLGFGTVTPSPQ